VINRKQYNHSTSLGLVIQSVNIVLPCMHDCMGVKHLCLLISDSQAYIAMSLLAASPQLVYQNSQIA